MQLKLMRIILKLKKKIIKRAMVDLNKINSEDAEKLLKLAKKKEEASNQIVEFTREIKKIPNGF